MIILCNTLIPKDRVQAIPTDIGETVNSIPVIDKIFEVDVAPTIIIESVHSYIVFRVL